MLKMEGVSKIYRTELIETHALREVNLVINEGEFGVGDVGRERA